MSGLVWSHPPSVIHRHVPHGDFARDREREYIFHKRRPRSRPSRTWICGGRFPNLLKTNAQISTGTDCFHRRRRTENCLPRSIKTHKARNSTMAHESHEEVCSAPVLADVRRHRMGSATSSPKWGGMGDVICAREPGNWGTCAGRQLVSRAALQPQALATAS